MSNPPYHLHPVGESRWLVEDDDHHIAGEVRADGDEFRGDHDGGASHIFSLREEAADWVWAQGPLRGALVGQPVLPLFFAHTPRFDRHVTL